MQLKNLLNIKRQINKPEYFFNPKQLVQRALYKNNQQKKVLARIDQTNLPFYVNENEVIGRSILTMGVYDLIVAETIKRIIHPQDHFLDIGANIGYFSRMALSYGAHTISFEPHPHVFKRLQENLKDFKEATLHNFALSNQKGSFDLYIPKNFESNEGIASLEPMENSDKIQVQTETLDSLITTNIKLVKIDVEGHESSVLEGARDLLKQKKIDFLVFEDFDGLNSKVIKLLKDFDYKVYRLKKNLMGPELVSLSESEKIPLWEPPNFIASHTDSLIKDSFFTGGWSFFKK